MKIGSIDILKAYLGALELTNSNAFIGTIPVIENGPEPVIYPGLKFTSTSNSTIAMSKNGSAPTVDLKYSLNGGKTWTQWDFSAISLTNGQTVCFKGLNTTFATGTSDYNNFVMTGSIAASGNLMSIIDDGACTTTTIPADYCFCGMFYNCTSLTTAPALPATTLKERCYGIMFKGCTSLTTAPELPATTLSHFCYSGMFQNCTALTTAHELPATTLGNYCYSGMFNGCSKLTTAPELPATTLGNYCYNIMFQNCTALTTAPALPATTLKDSCYKYMFNGCTSLTTAPELPATTLANYCYNSMFQNCTALTTAPELPATTLIRSCYGGMFSGCTNLNYIKCLATDISAANCTSNWVNGVAASGTFTKAASMNDWTTGANGIPEGWIIENEYVGFVGLKFTSTGNSTVAMAKNGSAPTVDLKYSLDDGETWTQWGFSEISLSDGQTVCFKGLNTTFATSSNAYNKFVMTGSIAASGNLMSIIDDGACTTTTIPANYCFYKLFRECTSLTTAPELPATTLTEFCYYNMFARCTNLKYIKCLATNISAADCTTNWVYRVASGGTFVKDSSMNDWATGSNGIPSGWTVQNAA